MLRGVVHFEDIIRGKRQKNRLEKTEGTQEGIAKRKQVWFCMKIGGGRGD